MQLTVTLFGRVFSWPRGGDNLSSDRQLHLLIDGVTDYAIFMLSPEGIVTSWNRGAERIKGYPAKEIAIIHKGTIDPDTHFIAKPFTLEDLARKVHEVLGR